MTVAAVMLLDCSYYDECVIPDWLVLDFYRAKIIFNLRPASLGDWGAFKCVEEIIFVVIEPMLFDVEH